MDRLLQASATRALVVVASAGVAPLTPPYAREEEGGVAGRFGNATAGIDPHAWQRVANAELCVANIRDGLIRADPRERATYEANAAAYNEELARLDADIRRAVAMIPPARRKVITTHEAFGYFATDCGMAFIAAQGLSTEVEPSAKDIARIIRTVRQQNIPALFFENAVDPRLIRRIAAETGARIGGTLFSDTLTGPAGPAPTYLDMMRHNIREIIEALNCWNGCGLTKITSGMHRIAIHTGEPVLPMLAAAVNGDGATVRFSLAQIGAYPSQQSQYESLRQD